MLCETRQRFKKDEKEKKRIPEKNTNISLTKWRQWIVRKVWLARWNNLQPPLQCQIIPPLPQYFLNKHMQKCRDQCSYGIPHLSLTKTKKKMTIVRSKKVWIRYKWCQRSMTDIFIPASCKKRYFRWKISFQSSCSPPPGDISGVLHTWASRICILKHIFVYSREKRWFHCLRKHHSLKMRLVLLFSIPSCPSDHSLHMSFPRGTVAEVVEQAIT